MFEMILIIAGFTLFIGIIIVIGEYQERLAAAKKHKKNKKK